MKKLLTIILLSIILPVTAEGARPRNSRSIRQQQQATEKRIRETDEQIRENARKVTAQLNQLNRLDGEIAQCNAAIGKLNGRIDSIKAETQAVNDSIAKLDDRLGRMQESFASALRDSRKARTSMSKLAFVFSSESFSQAFRRVRTLRQFTAWRNRKSGEIAQVKALLDERRQRLDTLEIESREAVSTLASRKTVLVEKQREASNIMADLKGKDRQLRQVLKEQKRKAASLDAELDRLIAAEQKAAEEQRRREEAETRRREQERLAQEEARRREAERAASANNKQGGDMASNISKAKPAEVAKPAPKNAPKNAPEPKPKPTASTASQANVVLGAKFGDNKGRLPYPVDGIHTIVKPFGRQRHPRFPNIEINNSGIDMETASGATVKSVFEGRVSEIFCPDGYNNVVVVRHGDYVTVYANLGTLSVRKGDSVSRGQALGTVYVDHNDENRSVLHFEIRNATNVNNVKKEDPQAWLR